MILAILALALGLFLWAVIRVGTREPLPTPRTPAPETEKVEPTDAAPVSALVADMALALECPRLTDEQRRAVLAARQRVGP